MARFNPPAEFDFTKLQTWLEWRKWWNRFYIASELDKKSETVQVSSLLYSMGQQSETVFQAFTFGADESQEDITLVLKKFDAHFVPAVNRIHERAKFHSRIQQPGENVETYLRTLYKLIETCGYEGAAKDEAVRDQLVVGISDKECSQKLQLMDSLTLADAIEICRTFELIKNQMASQKETTAIEAVFARNRPQCNRQRRPQQKRHQQTQSRPQRCSQFGATCNNCGKFIKIQTTAQQKVKLAIIVKRRDILL